MTDMLCSGLLLPAHRCQVLCDRLYSPLLRHAALLLPVYGGTRQGVHDSFCSPVRHYGSVRLVILHLPDGGLSACGSCCTGSYSSSYLLLLLHLLLTLFSLLIQVIQLGGQSHGFVPVIC